MSDNLRDSALDYHRWPKAGKIEITPTKPLSTQRDLALAYSPGVAFACDLVKAFAVNRFRGDPSLFEDGVRILEEKSRKPCLGVFPMAPDIELDADLTRKLKELATRSGASRS